MSRSYLVPILLPANPTAAMEAATKKYVDDSIAAIPPGATDFTQGYTTYDPRYVNASGDSMTGALTAVVGTGNTASFSARNSNDEAPFYAFHHTNGTRFAYIRGANTGLSIVNEGNTAIIFTTNGAEASRIDSGGNYLFQKTANDITVGGAQIITGGMCMGISSNVANTPMLALNKYGTGLGPDHHYINFRNTNTNIGSITRNASTSQVSYNTTSDYRLKDDRGLITGALERLGVLKPRRVVWKEDPTQTEMDGFFAHEVAEAVPESVTGEKDAVARITDDDRGMERDEIVPQQLDQSKLIPLLVSAVQELAAEVAALKAQLAT